MIFARPSRNIGSIAAAIAIALSAPGCNAINRMQDIGSPPPLTVIENPTTKATYRTVSMPMPTPVALHHQANSLWRPGAKAFFKDQRAAKVGDILTVTVTIDEGADISNTTTRTRTTSEDLGLDQFLGYQGSLVNILPTAVNNAKPRRHRFLQLCGGQRRGRPRGRHYVYDCRGCDPGSSQRKFGHRGASRDAS